MCIKISVHKMEGTYLEAEIVSGALLRSILPHSCT